MEKRWGGATLIAIAALGGVLSGCAGSGGGGGGGGSSRPRCKPPAPGTETVLFARNIQPIFDRSCAVAGCHTPPANQGGLDLTSSRSYGNLVGVASTQQNKLKRVVPGDPDKSYVVRKIEGGPGITGTIMPQGCDAGIGLNGAACLSAGDMEAIRQWIKECAQNN
jgi:hypothetical protein